MKPPHTAPPAHAAPHTSGHASGEPHVCTAPLVAAALPSYSVRLAPYALVRATVAAYPAQSPPSAAFRAAMEWLVLVEAEAAAGLPGLLDALYDSRAGHGEDFHREVVLPLRRDLHNAREPRPALLARLGDLPDRVPALARRLHLRRCRATALDAVAATADSALAAERAALAALCRHPAVGRAVALTSPDLLRAVVRAGASEGPPRDRRSRKEEAGVLRYALRATTRSSPLSWFTAVGWGLLPEPVREHGPLRDPVLPPADSLTSCVRVNRTLVGALSAALLADPRRRARLPHRPASTPRPVPGGRTAFRTTRQVLGTGRYLALAEEDVELPAGGPLQLITALCEHPSLPAELARQLADRLAAAGTPPAAAHDAAEAFVGRLADTGVLVPVAAVDPQDPEPLAQWARWLREDGGRPGDTELAARLDEIACSTREFAAAEPARRPALTAGLSASWHALLADAGGPVPAGDGPLTVLSEDVVAPDPVPLDGALHAADHAALAELTGLAELFDVGHLMRRIVRDRFVARYGDGGVCPRPWEFGAEVADAWEAAGRLPALLPDDGPQLPSGVAELGALRRETAAGVRTEAAVAGAAGAAGSSWAPAPDAVLPPDLVRGLGRRLPRWALQRPVSYGYFVQRGTPAGLLCVNHMYGGWGRFTSRFLDAMAPAAAAEVARQIAGGLGPDATPVQVRPVSGFNANLHPLLVPDAIGPDHRWTSLAESDVDLVHDVPTDQVRVRLRATGALLDVLYAGFLAPVMLPQRLAPLLCDHPNGVVDFSALVPRTALAAPGGQVVHSPRLRHRHLVLRRRRWSLPAPVAAALRADLTSGPALPAAVVARWRARLGLPAQLFLHPAPTAPTGAPAQDFLAATTRPKPQFLDLSNPLHLHLLPRTLARHPTGLTLEEALPTPTPHPHPTPATELFLETYRPTPTP